MKKRFTQEQIAFALRLDTHRARRIGCCLAQQAAVCRPRSNNASRAVVVSPWFKIPLGSPPVWVRFPPPAPAIPLRCKGLRQSPCAFLLQPPKQQVTDKSRD
jgi:hypothetical protein